MRGRREGLSRVMVAILFLAYLTIQGGVGIAKTSPGTTAVHVIPPQVTDVAPPGTFEINITVTDIVSDPGNPLVNGLHSWGFWLEFNPSVLEVASHSEEETDVAARTGDGTQTTFQTDEWPVVPFDPDPPFYEGVYVNDTLMNQPDDYTIDYPTGTITFVTAPGLGADIGVLYRFYVPVYHVTSGHFLEKAGWQTAWGSGLVAPSVNNVNGVVGVGDTIMPDEATGYPPEGATGSGLLATITFQVKAEGASLLHLDDTDLDTIVGEHPTQNFAPIDHTVQHGVFDNRVPPPPLLPPVANFYAEPPVAEVNETIIFNASASYDPDAWLVSYEWDFGDGTAKVYIRNVNFTAITIHAYEHSGTYTVTLTVTDYDNKIDTFTADVIVGHDIAVTSVTVSHIAVMVGVPVTINVTMANEGGFPETFNVTAYYDNIPIKTEDVTDLHPGTIGKLAFEWNTTGVDLGTYTIKAVASTVTDEFNTTNNEFIDGTVIVGEVSIVPHSVEVGGVTFYVVTESNSTVSNFKLIRADKKISFNVTKPPGYPSATYFCNVTIPKRLLVDNATHPWLVLLDGENITDATSSAENANHTFIYFTYNFTYTPSTRKVEIIGATVATPPVASFTISPAPPYYVGDTLTFDASASNDPDGTIVSYEWDFGDDTNATLADPVITHIYELSQNLTYQIRLTVTDNYTIPLKDTYYKNATVTALKPVANFTISKTKAYVKELITFDASASYDPDLESIVSYEWDFGDGNITTAADPVITHIYTASGTYIVNLTVTDNQGLTANTTDTITISAKHDVAVVNVTSSPSEVTVGELVSINVTVANQGTETETFDITVYYDNVIIETKSVTNLPSGASKTLTINWETTNVDPETYTIAAVASTITGEIDTTNNEFIGDTVTVTAREGPAVGILPYVAAAVVAAVIIVAIAFYFLKARK